MPALASHDRNTRGMPAAPSPKFCRNVGGWVIVWAVLAVMASLILRDVSGKLKDAVTTKWNQEMVAGAAPRNLPSLVAGREPLPQAFNHAFESGDGKVNEAKALREALVKTKEIQAGAWTYHYWDLAFILSYGMYFILGARWAWRRSDLLGTGTLGTTVRLLAFAGAPAGAIAVAADLVEFALCALILSGTEIREGVLTILSVGYWIKWTGVIVGSIAVLGGMVAMASSWRTGGR
jgi:hypothetical protein